MNDNRRETSPIEPLALLALATLLAAGVLVWVWAALAGLLFGSGWPPDSAGQLAGALIRLPGHLSDPRMAWPAATRDRLPAPPGFYAALVILLAVVSVLVAGLTRAHTRGLFSANREDERRGARWARAGELRLLLPRRQRRRDDGRLGLGYRGRRLLRGEARHALVVFGPTQSFKSAGLAIPALLEWDGPAVASSTKTDLLAATIRARENTGEVMVFDPFGLSTAPTATWSPLRACGDWDGALSTAMRLSAGGELDTTSVRGGSYWQAAAEQRLAPLLWTAAHTGTGIGAMVRWAYGQGDAELPAILTQLLHSAPGDRERADAQAAFDAHAAFEALAADTRSSIESTVQMLLRAYRSPRVQASAAGSQITPDRLLDHRGTLYLVGDSHRSKLLRPIFLALLQELIDHAYQHATFQGGLLRDPLLLCLDELGNVAPLPNLGEIASTAASHNIQLVSIFHDIAQARARYGEQTLTVINNHRARMLLPGVADLD
ncbi:MAG TPA: type IV secretory system conjugative DNA transfer family protein, partial [Solirubrobacteraceae bacterium]|nr:type IV secretory system conjugative DNA transfer family protein [Solirubrobacteraceae bacterium]